MSNVWIKHPQTSEVFTFTPAMVQGTSDGFELEVDQNKMPGMGPMMNQGMSFSGVGKTVTISGLLLDTTSSVLSSQNLRDKQVMKYWLESLPPASFIRPIEFSVPSSEKAISSVGGTTPFPDTVTGANVNIPGQWVVIKGYLIAQSFEPTVGEPDKITFSMTFWISGF